jgi:hypothetical protein
LAVGKFVYLSRKIQKRRAKHPLGSILDESLSDVYVVASVCANMKPVLVAFFIATWFRLSVALSVPGSLQYTIESGGSKVGNVTSSYWCLASKVMLTLTEHQ